MRIIVAPDKFKGSAGAAEVAASLAAGLRRGVVDPSALEVIEIPVADGGEGTVEAAIGAGFTPCALSVTGPVGLPVRASYAVRGDSAVIEMAQASGLDVLPTDAEGEPVLDAIGATSRGTGELIAHALDHGARRIVLGVGGSACTDGGAGMLAALGVRWLDDSGEDLPRGGAALHALARVDLSGLHPAVAGAEFVLAADVDNPLLGERGASAIFGPQKGADADQVEILEQGLSTLRDRLGEALGEVALTGALAPGAGAAGGLGYAALTVLGAHRRPGIEVVLELVGLAVQVRDADLVITGEGSLDEQSLGGKTPLGVLRLAQREGVPVHVVCGRSLLTAQQLQEAGFTAVHPLVDRVADPLLSMREAPRLLREVGEEIGRGLTAAPLLTPASSSTPASASASARVPAAHP